MKPLSKPRPIRTSSRCSLRNLRVGYKQAPLIYRPMPNVYKARSSWFRQHDLILKTKIDKCSFHTHLALLAPWFGLYWINWRVKSHVYRCMPPVALIRMQTTISTSGFVCIFVELSFVPHIQLNVWGDGRDCNVQFPNT